VYIRRHITEIQNNVYDIPHDSSLTKVPEGREKLIDYILEATSHFPILVPAEIRKTKIPPTHQSL